MKRRRRLATKKKRRKREKGGFDRVIRRIRFDRVERTTRKFDKFG